MPTVKSGAINLYYEQYGKGDPIIFAHAYLDDCSVWKAQIEALASTYTVIVYDHRGHGKSDKPASDYSVRTLADDLYALILGLNLERVILVGNSIGGATILTFALAHPEKVSKLVLVCTAAKFSIPLGRALKLLPYGVFLRMHQSLKFYRSSALQHRQALARSMQVPKVAAYSCWTSLLSDYDIRRQVSDIDVPTLIVASDKDRAVSARMSRFLNRSIRRSRLKVIPDCGHSPMVEKPEEFNKLLTTFLG